MFGPEGGLFCELTCGKKVILNQMICKAAKYCRKLMVFITANESSISVLSVDRRFLIYSQ